MPVIRVRRTIRAPIGVVWDALADIEAHVEWMADARAIRFTSTSREGVGTSFDCDTKVGPLRLVDRMRVTAWEPERRLAVRHVGVATGEGEFTMRPVGDDRTELVWDEALELPWYLPSGPAGFVLRQIWRRNLRRFERTLGPTARPAARRPGPRRRRAG